MVRSVPIQMSAKGDLRRSFIERRLKSLRTRTCGLHCLLTQKGLRGRLRHPWTQGMNEWLNNKQARIENVGDDLEYAPTRPEMSVQEAGDDPHEVPPMVLDAEGGRDVDANPAAGFIGGLPTLHETDIICRVVVDSSNYENIYDEKTGEYLEPEEIKIGVENESNQMQDFQVKVDITPSGAGEKQLKIVRPRWVFTREPTPRPRAVRAPYVAQEHNNHKREDVSRGTPPLKIHRMTVSLAGTATGDSPAGKKLVGR